MNFRLEILGIRLGLEMSSLIQGRSFARLAGSKDIHFELSQLRIVSINLVVIATVQPFFLFCKNIYTIYLEAKN